MPKKQILHIAPYLTTVLAIYVLALVCRKYIVVRFKDLCSMEMLCKNEHQEANLEWYRPYS